MDKVNFNNWKEAKKSGWIQSDPDCKQYRKEIVKDKIYVFREERTIHPVTGETEVYESDMNIDDYTREEIYDAGSAFGYTHDQMDEFLETEVFLVLECLFELES